MGRRLDYFLVDECLMKEVKRCEIRNKIEGGDHCPIELYIDETKESA